MIGSGPFDGNLTATYSAEGIRRLPKRRPLHSAAVYLTAFLVAGPAADEGDVLGLWVGAGGEGAKAWMGYLAELRNRGIKDVCIVACDGLKGLPEAIGEIWPLATVQLWGGRYPAIVKLWNDRWEAFCPFLAFPPEIRRIVYTTNAIESLNARFRQATRRRGHFPSDQAALKVLYLVIRTPTKNKTNVTGKTTGWKTALNALSLYPPPSWNTSPER